VSVSAGSRNFPRRSGPGVVYLANPYVVAASALAGYIAAPDTMFEGVNP
jgi:3-isopropylmalate/(R)-2-methylmalate dehydratase large subunit